MKVDRTPSPASLVAHEAWKAAEAALAEHRKTEPPFPSPPIGGWPTEDDHRAASSLYDERREGYWQEHGRLDRARREAFEAMARTLPKVPVITDRRRFSYDEHAAYVACQVEVRGFDAYPALVRLTVRWDGEAVSADGGALCDDAISEAARRNAECERLLRAKQDAGAAA